MRRVFKALWENEGDATYDQLYITEESSDFDAGRSRDQMKSKKRLPKFKSEAEERRFWSTHDSTDYLDWSKAKRLSSLRGFLKEMKTGPTREKRNRY